MRSIKGQKMNMKNAVKSSLFIVLMLCGCDNKAEPVGDETLQPLPQEQYERGKIETHSTE